MSSTVGAIAKHLGGTVEGDAGREIRGMAGLHDAGPTDVSFVIAGRYERLASVTRAGALVVAADFAVATAEQAPAPSIIRVADPAGAVDRLVEMFRPSQSRRERGVLPGALVDPGAHVDSTATVMPGAYVGSGAGVGAGTVLYPGVYVGEGVQLGRACRIHPNVVIHDRVIVGDRVEIHPGSVLGGDGFGFRPGPAGLEKQPQIGSIRIGNDVEIGSLVAIDRARFGFTVIGEGTKIDNLVQIAHNVRVGRHCVIVAQTGISGSTVIGDGCVIGGQAGVVGHIEVGPGSKIAARSGISKDVPPGSVLYGFVAGEHRAKMREEAAVRRLPELLRRVKELEARIESLERAGAGPDDS